MRTLVTAIVIAMIVALILHFTGEGERMKERQRKASMDAACQVIVEAGLVKSCGLR